MRYNLFQIKSCYVSSGPGVRFHFIGSVSLTSKTGEGIDPINGTSSAIRSQC